MSLAGVLGDEVVAVVGPDGFFEAGSVTKTFTATLLAVLVRERVVSLTTTVGDVLGPAAGAAADVELAELGTHTSGLPRVPPNVVTVPFWPRDPYRHYTRDHLLGALSRVSLSGRGEVSYSNFGYFVLGACLESAAGRPFGPLLSERVLQPAGMHTARCQPCAADDLVPGRGSWLTGGRRWHQQLPAAGGVDCTIHDLAQWTRANVAPASTPLEDAIGLLQSTMPPIGWQHRDDVVWHNGGTGRYQGVVAVIPGVMGVAGLAAAAPVGEIRLDHAVLDWLAAL